MSRRPVLAAAAATVAAALAGGSLFVTPAGASDRRSEVVADRAVAFLASQQRADGGFGTAEAGFPGFETPDAVLAIAEAAQPTLAYDPAVARAAVRSIAKGDRDGLDYLDDLADGGVDAGKAAQLVIVAVAVGLDPRAFDPEGDGATDLVKVIDAAANADGSYGSYFNSTVQVVVAFAAIGRPVPSATVEYLKRAQQSSGGYDYTGDPNATGPVDVDTTARVIQALIAAKVPVADPSVSGAVALLANLQNADGSWSAFGEPDPNATAEAILAIRAAGFDPVDDCLRRRASVTKAIASPDEYLRRAQAADGHITSPNDQYGLNTFATAQAVQALQRSFQPIARADRESCETTGYRLVAADGGVFTHGDARFAGSTGDLVLNRPIVASAPTPSGLGYWLFATDGGVFAFGDAAFLGSTGDIALNQPIVAAAATPTGGGYWLFAADGGVFTFGDAAFLGSTGDRKLNQPIVGAASTPSGRGYWLFASDGGVFTFGDAEFKGSTGDRKLNQPIVGAASSLTGRGYWLFARDGGVFAFGEASFLGSAGGTKLNQPIVQGFRGEGEGYYLVAADGGIFTYGVPFLGSEGARKLNSPIVAGSL